MRKKLKKQNWKKKKNIGKTKELLIMKKQHIGKEKIEIVSAH